MDKIQVLKRVLERYERIAIAFSGGVDSSFLLSMAVELLGSKNVLALTARASTFPLDELEDSKEFADNLGVVQIIFDSNELELESFYSNPPDRCYHCKKAIFEKIISCAKKEGFTLVADGTNLDDMQDYRPGHKALQELGVLSPLKEASLTKDDIRHFSKITGLKTWNKPSLACLATRIPYGEKIDFTKLRMIENAEKIMVENGFKKFRVRHHVGEDKNHLARIELDQEEMPQLFSTVLMSKLSTEIKAVGYGTVSLDLAPYKSGNMNSFIQK